MSPAGDAAATVDLPRWPQANGLHLVLTSMGSVVIDTAGVRSVRAEDATGGFGLWPGHADFLTVLSVGVLRWRVAAGEAGAGEPGADGTGDGTWRHAAVRGGVLTLRRGCLLRVATREAVVGESLEALAERVQAQMTDSQRSEDEARRRQQQLAVRAMRELLRPWHPTLSGQGPLLSS